MAETRKREKTHHSRVTASFSSDGGQRWTPVMLLKVTGGDGDVHDIQ
jgi:hypothetical protein